LSRSCRYDERLKRNLGASSLAVQPRGRKGASYVVHCELQIPVVSIEDLHSLDGLQCGGGARRKDGMSSWKDIYSQRAPHRLHLYMWRQGSFVEAEGGGATLTTICSIRSGIYVRRALL
jgi:hypothetical protein